jgi:hypothetical protein
MIHALIPQALMSRLRANAEAGDAADPPPVLKLFNPAGAGTWLITEIRPDGDTLFGLCDLDMGCPELGYVALSEIAAVRLPGGLTIERDIAFRGRLPLSVWADLARDLGSIRAAEAYVAGLPTSAFTPPAGG